MGNLKEKIKDFKENLVIIILSIISEIKN